MVNARQALDSLKKIPDIPVKAPGEGALEAPSLYVPPSLPEISEEDYNAINTARVAPSTKSGSLIDKAKSFLGTPYVWGGTSPLGFDCSGFVQYVYKQMGLNLPRMSFQQARAGARVAIKDLRPGDLVAWDNSSRNNGADHISIYIGDGKVIHAPKPGDRVKISNIWDSAHAWGVRINF